MNARVDELRAAGQRVLDIEPTELHQRCPLFVGSPNMVDKLEGFVREFG